jgi:RecB family endonuclease NucS
MFFLPSTRETKIFINQENRISILQYDEDGNEVICVLSRRQAEAVASELARLVADDSIWDERVTSEAD